VGVRDGSTNSSSLDLLRGSLGLEIGSVLVDRSNLLRGPVGMGIESVDASSFDFLDVLSFGGCTFLRCSFRCIFPDEASLTLSMTEPTPCIRTIVPRDRLWKMGFHMAIELVGAGGGMRTVGVEARVSRGVVSESLFGGKEFVLKGGKA